MRKLLAVCIECLWFLPDVYTLILSTPICTGRGLNTIDNIVLNKSINNSTSYGFSMYLHMFKLMLSIIRLYMLLVKVYGTRTNNQTCYFFMKSKFLPQIYSPPKSSAEESKCYLLSFSLFLFKAVMQPTCIFKIKFIFRFAFSCKSTSLVVN